jgi:hypothetical protein
MPGRQERGELPQDFSWQEAPSLRARFPIPDGWYFKEEARGNTRACFITREPIDHKGVFVVGLTVNSILNVREATGYSPSAFAKAFMTTQREMSPLSDIDALRDSPLVIYRRDFQAVTVAGVAVKDPPRIYAEATGNDSTGTAYILLFESPLSMWKQNEQIGRVIIENRILDKSF